MKHLALVVVLSVGACGGKIDESAAVPSAGADGTADPGSSSGSSSEPSPGAVTANEDLHARASSVDDVYVQAGDASGACVRIHLTKNDLFGTLQSVSAPKGWHVVDIIRWKHCSGVGTVVFEAALEAKGEISWVNLGYQPPCTIDIHVAGTFNAKPEIERIDAEKLDVGNCR